VNDDDDDNNNVSGDDANENDDSSNMMLDAPESPSNLSSIDTPVNDPRPKVATEAEDGWVQVGPRRNRGKRN
jgi:hypothetical protein